MGNRKKQRGGYSMKNRKQQKGGCSMGNRKKQRRLEHGKQKATERWL